MNNEKFIRNATIAGGVFGLLIDAIEQWSKLQNQEQEKFDYSQLLGNGLKGAGIGFGASIAVVGLHSIFAPEELDEEDFEEVKYLESVLTSYELDKIDQATMKKGFGIKNKIQQAFKGMLLGRPKYQGSIPQGTALSGISDLDIIVKFKKTSFGTLEDMYCDTLDYFKNQFYDKSLVEVRPQRRSIGLIFDILGEQVCIDVVPAKRTNFERGGNEYNLYENASGWFGKPSRVKMNPHKQASFGTNAAAKANVVSLMKVLKVSEGMPLKSVFLKELTKDAFKKHRGKIPKDVDKQLIFTMEYIRDNIEYKRVTSPDNSNNILSDSLTKNEKRKVADAFDYIIRDVKEHPSQLKKYFPHRDDL